MSKRVKKNRSGGSSGPAAASPGGAGALVSKGYPAWFWWFLVCLTVFAVMPNMMSGNYMPKTFWAALTTALGLAACRRRGTGESIGVSPLGLIWTGYLGWALLSLAWGMQPRVGFERWLALALPTAAYFLALRTRFWRSDSFWLAYAGVFLIFCAIGCLQFVFDESQAPWVHWFPGTHSPRGTVGHRNYAGLYLTVSLPMVMAGGLKFRERRRWIFLTALFLGFLFLIFTRARQAWVGVAAGLMFMTVMIAPQYLKNIGRGRVLGLKLALSACFLLLVIGSAALLNPNQDIAGNLGDSKISLVKTLASFVKAREENPRRGMWDYSMSIPLNRVVGGGFGSFPIRATPFNREGRIHTLNWEVHNDYLQAFVDLGFVGLVLFILFWGWLVWLAWCQRMQLWQAAAGAGILGITVIQLFSFTSEKMSTLVWTAGLVAIVNASSVRATRWRWRVERSVTLSLNMLCVWGLVVYAGFVAATIHADRTIRAEAHRAKVAEVAIDYDKLAYKALPYAWLDANMVHTFTHQMAVGALRDGNLEAARIFAEKCAGLHPTDRIVSGILADIYERQGRPDDALKIYERLYKLIGPNPNCGFLEKLYNAYRKRGEFEKAKKIASEVQANILGPPVSPEPANLATNVPLDVKLCWAPIEGADNYEIFFWREGEGMPDKAFKTGMKEPRLVSLERFWPNASYFWRVKGNGRLDSVMGPIWSFKTGPSDSGEE